MSTETQQYNFFVGDLVEVCTTEERGHIEAFDGWAYLIRFEDDPDCGAWYPADHLTPIVCDYCDSRKGCACQEDIDAREADWFHTQMDAAERDHWTEDKDRRADEEEGL